MGKMDFSVGDSRSHVGVFDLRVCAEGSSHHTLAAVLTADIAGIMGAVVACKYLFG